jgi:hypothetical protein
MIEEGLFTLNLDNFIKKPWNLGDQRVAFNCNFAASQTPMASLVEPIIQPFNYDDSSADLKLKGHILSGIDLTESFLNQSLEYFQKALYNFACQYLLAQRGYSTWATVTNYYSSYFSLFSLLALQGRAITRIRLKANIEIPCLIHPVDLRNHKYVLTIKENRDSTHKLPWKKFYEIYDQYTLIKPEFDVVQKLTYVTSNVDESEGRNRVNYKIFEGFQEVINISDLNAFKTQYESSINIPPLGEPIQSYITSLHALATDPELQYFSRSALRLILIKYLFTEVGGVNAQFDAEFKGRIQTWYDTLFKHHSPAKNYFEDFIDAFLV